MNLYIGNISPGVKPAELQQMFAGLGEVLYAQLGMPESNPRSTGFAFVYVPNEERARTAVATLNGKELKGEVLTVSPMPERPGVVRAAKK